jgi:hypothetical protein
MRAVRLSVLALAVSIAGTARAEPVPSLDLRNFHPPADPKGSLYLEPSATPGAGEWNAGAWLSYSYRSVTLEDSNGDRFATPLKHQLSLDYVAAVGVLDSLAVSLSLPTVLYQNGEDAEAVLGDGQLPQTALGDAAFGAKATLVPTSELGGFGLATLARVTAPTGDSRAYVSDGAVTGELRLLGELRLIAIALQATAGAKIRGRERTYVGEDFGHDLPWGLGISVRPQAFGLDKDGRWTWTAEARGQVAITPEFASGAQSPILAGISARYAVGDVSAIAGVELPLNGAVGSPSVRGVLGVMWAPRFYDQDRDGISDDEDQCAELAEDKDGFEDQDGCTDFDNDDDGVPDDEDRCPTAAEDEDEFQDDDGCPDPDNDSDGVSDAQDKCPNDAGPATGTAAPGCPNKDADGDGVQDGADKCKDQPEDKDGWQDEDGCPDLDNDGDLVPDEEDACPTVRGDARSDAKLNGCPSPDKDGDTFDDSADKCPSQPEDFDGVEDEDGCLDDDSDKPAPARARPLVTIEKQADQQYVKWRIAPIWVKKGESVELDPKTTPSVRALSLELNRQKLRVALVGVKPTANTPAGEQEALNKSFALVLELRNLTHRDSSAESIGWSAVKGLPEAYRGFGVLILQPTPGTPPPSIVPPAKAIKPARPAPPAPPPAPAPTTPPVAPKTKDKPVP